MGQALLQPLYDSARERREITRVLLPAAEGLGRSHLLKSWSAVKRIDVSRGPLVTQTLRAFLPAYDTDDGALEALLAAPQLKSLDEERARTAAELLASLLGIRRANFRTAKLDEDSRREGALLELARWVTEAARDGLVLAFDDAHLSTDEGTTFIESLSVREEPVPLLLVVSYDADESRFTSAFKTRRTAWKHDPRWRTVDLVPPTRAEVLALLEQAGASPARAEAFCELSRNNPGLALGLHAVAPMEADLSTLPRTHDGLRLFRVKQLGDDALKACGTLASLGGVAPMGALNALSPGLAVSLQPALAAGIVESVSEGVLQLLRFTDTRMKPSLANVLPQAQALGAKLSAGAWAVQALESSSTEHFARVAELLVPLATPALDASTTSYWYEATAAARAGRGEAIASLEAALKHSQGVRRLVLLRRLAELKLFLGLPEEAMTVVTSAGRTVSSSREVLPGSAVGRVLSSLPRTACDVWESMTLDEAFAALDLVRAECVSHLVKKEETQAAFSALERKLLRLHGPVASHLWIRWAKAWSWFLCEVMGQGAEAVRVCEQVRKHVPPDVLQADEDAIALVRAEEIAATSLGEFTRAIALTDEHIALADRAGRPRDACLGWNARAIVLYGQGQLAASRKAFEKSLELARATGWLRREAITLHNLTLVLTELGDYDAAFAGESLYGRLSVLMGNHAGLAEAPLVLASIELARGRFVEADKLIATARKVAEANGWEMLLAWSRALAGRLRLLRYKKATDALELSRAKTDFLAALETYEERSLAWTEELDPAEVYAHYALTLKWGGQLKQARDTLTKAAARFPKDNAISHAQLALALGSLEGPSKLEWFESRGFVRRVDLWRALTA